ncbi:MAG: hypothetical protein AB7I18_00795 [Candidatus Berkiella sp.]
MIKNAPTASHDVNQADVYQDLVNAIYAKNCEEAIELFKVFGDPTRVEDLVDVLILNPIPEIWLAAFQNDVFKEQLDSRHLRNLISTLELMSFKLSTHPEKLRIINKIYQIIIVNCEWCQSLSYSYFIPLTRSNGELASMISQDHCFMRMLEPVHLKNLIHNCPTVVIDVLKGVERYFGAEYANDRWNSNLWAKETIRYLLEKSAIARKAVFTENAFDSLRERLELKCDSGGSASEPDSNTLLANAAQRLERLVLELKDDELEDEDDYEHFDARYYTNEAVLLMRDRLAQLDDDLEEAEDEEEVPQRNVGLRRTKSFYFKNE